MPSLIGFVLLIIGCNLVFTLLIAWLRSLWDNKKGKRGHDFVITGPLYAKRKSDLFLRKHLIGSCVFLCGLSIFIADGFFQILLVAVLVAIQSTLIYVIMIRQRLYIYVKPEGIYVAGMVHPVEKRHLGKKKWDEVTYIEWEQGILQLGGDDFEYELVANDEQVRRILERKKTYPKDA